MRVTFTEIAMSQYMARQGEDKKTLKRINALIQSIRRDGVKDIMRINEAMGVGEK